MRLPFGKGRFVAALVLAMAAVACGGSGTAGTPSSSPSSQSATSKVMIKAKTATVDGKSEKVLADAKSGLTLYYFTPDKGGKVTCAGDCLVAWPPELLPSGMSRPTAAGGVPGPLGAVSSSSSMVATYKGWPLYTYEKDKDDGDVYGQNVGGKWFVAALDIPSATAG
jgi:predicted lipoprotein with Yx(FWY)xxD motif